MTITSANSAIEESGLRMRASARCATCGMGGSSPARRMSSSAVQRRERVSGLLIEAGAIAVEPDALPVRNKLGAARKQHAARPQRRVKFSVERVFVRQTLAHEVGRAARTKIGGAPGGAHVVKTLMVR